MKKTLIALCGAAMTIAALAEGPAPEGDKPEGPKPEMRQRGPRGPRGERGPGMRGQRPLNLMVDAKTDEEKIAKFKAEVMAKIDETVAAQRAKPAEEAKPVSIVLFVNERGGFRPGPGMRGNGGPEGRRPRRGNGRPEGAGNPPPAPEAPAAE